MKKNYNQLPKVFFSLLLAIFILLVSGIGNRVEAQNLTINLKNVTLDQVLREIQKNSDLFILYDITLVKGYTDITISLENVPIEAALSKVLENTSLTYEIKDSTIILKKKGRVTPIKEVDEIPKNIEIRGRIFQRGGKPMPGVVVFIKNTTIGAVTDNNGDFRIKADMNKNPIIETSYTGFLSKEIVISATNPFLEIVLEQDIINVEDVVVTGIFNRKSESYTGSSTTLTAKDIQRVGNQNLFQSLRNLDPTLFIMDNLNMGSNPNILPDMQMRGTSTFQKTSDVKLKGNYQNMPNQPLFVLDGFETTVERIFDLDMNRIESITILKDASAKALYGSKAANGVVIVETKRIKGNRTFVSYVGSLDITVPDLTSYNLTNAFEKLEVERYENYYDGTFPDGQVKRMELYYERLKLAKEGLNTYWLSKPLRTGIGSKHSLSVEVGDSQGVKGVIDVAYNNVKGVMKGSDRTNISGAVNLSYRIKDFSFRNIMSFTGNNSYDSPYGEFSEYSEMNPYYRAEDENGQILRIAGKTDGDGNVYNPMYNSTIGTLYKESYIDFTNNFYAEWNINKEFKLVGRVGVSTKRSDADEFLPSIHSIFNEGKGSGRTTEELLRRGSYELQNGKSMNASADLNLNYNKTVDKHNLFANLGTKVGESSSKSYLHFTEGFPSNMGADITFARGYALDSRPQSASTLKREIKFLGFLSYSYDDRYFVDLTYSTNASSLYGKDNRWSSGWSVGMGYNLHNEEFLKNNDLIKQLKIRGSVGVTGSQNFDNNEAVATYQYYTNVNYGGFVGSYMANLANNQLKWEQKKDYNIGLDSKIGPVVVRFDYFNALTENMVTNVTVPTSTGYSMVKDNLGLVRNRGFELYLGATIFQNSSTFINVFGSATTLKNTIVRLSDGMKAYNDTQKKLAADLGNSKPVLMYQDGQSMDAIWAVPSLGIDPNSGQEIYVKQDGTTTYNYSALDLKVIGDSQPKYRGNIGFTAEHKGFGLSVTCRFLGGGEYYNSTLVNRVENIDVSKNVDRRVLVGRWKEQGQITEFKRLGMNEVTRATSRFVQKRNEFDIGSISAYYDIESEKLRQYKIQRLKLSFYMNDVAKFSSIKIERGLQYPFARTMSFALNVTF